MAGIALLYANQGMAQCLNMEDCTALGYTETSCPDGGIKCPFGNGWFCNSITGETCIELGFTQTCSGTGYAGGDWQEWMISAPNANTMNNYCHTFLAVGVEKRAEQRLDATEMFVPAHPLVNISHPETSVEVIFPRLVQ